MAAGFATPKNVSTETPTDYYASFVEKIRVLKEQGHKVDLNRFSWEHSQQTLKDFKGNFSDFLEEERKA